MRVRVRRFLAVLTIGHHWPGLPKRYRLGHMRCMKILLATVISLFLGLGIGWYIGHRQAFYYVPETIREAVAGIESSDGEEAARAVRAIQAIDSGDAQGAVQLLSHPIANYYLVNSDVGTNDRRKRMIALIEQLARTNQIVAARITEFLTNYGDKTQLLSGPTNQMQRIPR